MRELRLRLPWSTLADLGVEELLRHLNDAGDGVRFRSLSCRGCSGTVMLEVDELADSDRIRSLDYVDAFDLVGRGPGRYEYLLRMELAACRDALDEAAGEFYVDGPVHLSDEGATLTAVASQDGLDHLDGAMAEVLASCEVLHVGAYDGRRDGLDGLTGRQREVLRTAYERGYFDVPRGVTPDELAAEFDLDKSTVLEHLRRAERNLLGDLLERRSAGLTPRAR